MRFVIVGAGRVGLRTARVLKESGHEVVVVDSDQQAIDRAANEGFEAVQGDGSTEATLAAAGVERADALGALTGDLNDNFIACLVANHHGCRTVLRIDEDYREDIYRKYASEVDEVIYPERLGAIAAKNALLGGSIRAVADIARNLQLVELTVTDDAPMRGYTLSELELPAKSQLLAFGKHGESYGLPDADVSLESGDNLVVLADFGVLDDVRRIVVGDTQGRTAAAGGA
ncbi:potassium channel family protein [Halorientalis litorea]|jgi:trk system potassium uptake protein TrkA|uniref:potassium channel family protein n=1 Tax=Halorientalis litorea TaxID=2931977 RepID=UPI001FF55E9A|nr:TrkA family potassium uptake protein [Halorientalis litorea]